MNKQLEEWIFLAQSDLKSARLIFASEENISHICIYHAHQSVEKMMKAYLHAKDHEVSHTHDLKKLLLIISKLEESWMLYQEQIIDLDEYYPKTRYPYGDILAKEDARTCLGIAEKLCKELLIKINLLTKKLEFPK